MKILTVFGFLLAFCWHPSNTSAQSISGGIGYAQLFSKQETEGMLRVAVRGNFIQPHDELSISVGTNLGLSIGKYWEQYGPDWLQTNYLVMDFPITLDLNVGGFATNEADYLNGFFIGGGYGLIRYAVEDDFGIRRVDAIGPVVNTGMRVPLIEGGLEFRGSLMMNRNTPSISEANDALIYTLGITYIL